MDFFPSSPDLPDWDEPLESPQPVWLNPPQDVLPGVVPVELVLGRSENTVVLLTGMRAFPTGLQMSLEVRVRGRLVPHDLNGEVFGGARNRHGTDPARQAGGLKWGFELADGRRVTNVDAWPEQPNQDHTRPHHPDDWRWEPDHPVLSGGGGGGGRRSVERTYWLWPLPPAGRLRVVCQWTDQGIEIATQDLDAALFLDAAGRARPAWPAD